MHEWCLEVSGDYACFTRPEMKVERVSYDVITPSAARAIFESILWKPAIKWHITKIEVLNPIKWINIRRNEISAVCQNPPKELIDNKANAKKQILGINIEDCRQQRAGLFLRDVKYRIYGYFEFIPQEKRNKQQKTPDSLLDYMDKPSERSDETEAKYAAMFERRAQKGQCFHTPYLGCREFACSFKLVNPELEPSSPIKEDSELGWMLYDMDYSDPTSPTPCFFKASMKQGVLNTNINEIEVRK